MFKPLKLRDVIVRNRTFVSAMCQYSAKDGIANDWHLVHLGSRAVGGAGCIVFEATSVTADGRISPEDLGIWSDEHIEPLARVVRFCQEQGAKTCLQLAHAGRKACTYRPWEGRDAIPADDPRYWSPVYSASDVPVKENYQTPMPLTEAGIDGLVQAFADAAVRADKAGFDMVEIHGAHGYLTHQFLSPITNKRADQYGGSLENRARFLYRMVEAIQAVWPKSKPVLVRLSATDYIEGGFDVDECVEVCRRLKELGVDMIDVSSGGLDSAQKFPNPLLPGYQVPFAERIKKDVGIPTLAVGMIQEANQAEAIITEGKADAVAIAREFLRDTYWTRHAMNVLNVPLAEMPWPDQYQWTLGR